MLLSGRLKEQLISSLTRLSVVFQKDHGSSAVPSERQVQILTSGLSVGSQGEATLIYGFSCCLKSYGENTKGCCHLKPVSCSHIKFPFKTGEGFLCLLSHFLLSPMTVVFQKFVLYGFPEWISSFLSCFLLWCTSVCWVLSPSASAGALGLWTALRIMFNQIVKKTP